MSETLNRLPAKGQQRVCLVLIVKDDFGSDESQVLPRLLESCKGFISSVAAILTHREATQHGACRSLLENWCERQNLVLRLADLVWEDNFSTARNAALALAKDIPADWLLLLDCDEELHLGLHLPMVLKLLREVPPSVPAFVIPLVLGPHALIRVNLVRNVYGWSYRYRHHETLEFNDGPVSYLPMGNFTAPDSGPYVFTASDGARSKREHKHEQDAMLLQKAWDEDRVPRYLFFLGMEMMSAGHLHAASLNFNDYIEEEHELANSGMVYYALVQQARCCMRSKGEALVEADLLKAYRLCPARPEALGELALWHANGGRWPEAYLYALAAMQPVTPIQLEFLEPMWAQWRALDILTVCLINMGRYAEAEVHLKALLQRKHLPSSERLRVQDHLTNITRRPTS